jgi:hypothetical protein
MKNATKQNETMLFTGTPSFIARSSQIGKLMVNDRSGKKIGETAITELKKIVLFDKYGIKTDISSKYTDKGLQNEKIAIKMMSDVNGWFDVDPDAMKIRFANEWITGEPDVNTKSILADAKCSFDATTFPFFDSECSNKIYFYQLQSYMWLTGKNESFLCYCLTNQPEQMILDEINRAVWRGLANPKFEHMDQSEIETMMEKHVRSQWMFDQIPLKKRVKTFRIERDENVIESMKNRIIECREIYNQFWNQI